MDAVKILFGRSDAIRYSFKESEHPRDDDGKFTSTDSASDVNPADYIPKKHSSRQPKKPSARKLALETIRLDAFENGKMTQHGILAMLEHNISMTVARKEAEKGIKQRKLMDSGKSVGEILFGNKPKIEPYNPLPGKLTETPGILRLT